MQYPAPQTNTLESSSYHASVGMVTGFALGIVVWGCILTLVFGL